LPWDSYLVEIAAAGATKGEALARLARELDVPREAIIAIGDSDPDISMIEFAGRGVAVDNAKDHVKAASDYIAPRCDQDAVAHVVEHLILPDL
jgi:hydroxymethylpyrimidine pyrophosphatase-like HAD family hydrolase